MTKKLNYLLYLYIFLLPWQTRYIYRLAQLGGENWEYGTLSIYASEIVLWVLIILYLGHELKTHGLKLGKKHWDKRKVKLLISFYGFLAVAVASILYSRDFDLAIRSALTLLEAAALLVVILNLPFDRLKAVLAIIAAAVIQALLGIWQFVSQAVVANKWLGIAVHLPETLGDAVVEVGLERWLRAYGALTHPNVLAGFLVLTIFGLLYFSYYASNRTTRVAALVSLPVMSVALFFTFSRSAWLGLFLGVIYIVFRLWRAREVGYQKPLTQLSIIFVLTFLLLATNFFPLLAARFSTQERLEVKSLSERYAYTEQALDLIKNHWASGVGIGQYTLVQHEKDGRDFPAWLFQPVHNIYLLAFAELGVLGFVFFIAFILQSLWQSIRVRASETDYIWQGALLAMLFIGFFDHYLWTQYFGLIIFFVTLGLALKKSS